jgi:hypothetical protein
MTFQPVEAIVFAVALLEVAMLVNRALRVFWRRNQSSVLLDRMRWNSMGSSSGGLSP